MHVPEGHNDFVWAVIGSPWGLLAVWLAVINLVTFLVFGWDKWKAKYKEKHAAARRVPGKDAVSAGRPGGQPGGAAGDAGVASQDAAPRLSRRHPADPAAAAPDPGGAVSVLECDPVRKGR